MSIELILTSLIGLFSGVISLHTDPKDKKYRIWQLILLFLIVSSAGTTMYFGYQKEQESKRIAARKDLQIQDLNDNLSQVNKQNSELLKTVNLMQTELQTTGSDTKFIRDLLEPLGWSRGNLSNPSQNQINQSLQASQLLQTVSGDVEQRKGITVQYFPKNVDSNIVRANLENLGFALVTGNSSNELPTDSIWFGSGVDLNSVKAVAYTLLGAGVSLKAIRQFSNDNRRGLVIQVGGDPDCEDRPTLSAEEIRSASRFPLQSEVTKCQMLF